MAFSCPFAEKNKYLSNRLMCKKNKIADTNYSEPKNFITVMCLYQKFCGCKNEYLNTDSAKKCYEVKSKQ